MFVHCAQSQTAERIDTISFAYESHMSILDRFKIWLTSVSPPYQSDLSPVDLSVGDTR